jgi:hypothetical protein
MSVRRMIGSIAVAAVFVLSVGALTARAQPQGGHHQPGTGPMMGGNAPYWPNASRQGYPMMPMMQGGGMPMTGMPMMMQGGMPMMQGYPGMRMMGHGFWRGDKPFSADELRRVIDGKLAMRGFTRLKVGKVQKAGEDSFTADIVTKDNSLAARLTLDARTGRVIGVE